MLSLCRYLNAPVKTSKVEGPTTNLTFLGIVINMNTMQASISMERKLELTMELHRIYSLPKCTKHQLPSLVGKLSFACKVIPAGGIFLRHLIDLSCKVKFMHHYIDITAEARLDIAWWLAFLPSWDGTSYILETEWTTSHCMSLYSDASGTLGWGAYGPVDGSKPDGHLINPQEALYGRNFMQLCVLYTPGAASGHVRKFPSTVTT